MAASQQPSNLFRNTGSTSEVLIYSGRCIIDEIVSLSRRTAYKLKVLK